jgi:hypothetical protein
VHFFIISPLSFRAENNSDQVLGNGLGQSFFLAVTLSSGQVEWSASSGSHSFEVHSCEQFRRMVHFGGWCKTIVSLINGLDTHSL